MSAHTSTISVTHVGLNWADGTVAFSGISATFGRGRTGVVGRNGSGKTTLLRLIAGELAPAIGTIAVSGEVNYFPQNLILSVGVTAADLLGVRAKVDAFRDIHAGDASERNFDVLGDEWDIETKAGEAL